MKEDAFMGSTIAVARAQGWLVAHFRPAQLPGGRWVTPVAADGKGFPDLVLVRGARLIFAECKSDRGSLSTEQKTWLERLARAHAEVYVWRPKDQPAIDKILARDVQ